MLTVKDVADLKGCTERNIKKLILEGKLKATETKNEKNRKMYLIDPVDLPEKLKVKYYAGLGIASVPEQNMKNHNRKAVKDKTVDDCSEDEREEIALWCKILKRWQAERAEYGNIEQSDEEFVAAMRYKLRKQGVEIRISRDILYRKYQYYKANDFVNLLDDRGGWNRGMSSVPDELWEGFLWFYHDDRQPSFQKSYRDMVMWAERFYPNLVANIPSASSFYRRYHAEVPKVITTLMRKGEKAATDECLKSINRN